MQTPGNSKEGAQPVKFHFVCYHNGKHYRFNAIEVSSIYPISFMVSDEEGCVNFDWDGEEWQHQMNDEVLGKMIIEMLIKGYALHRGKSGV